MAAPPFQPRFPWGPVLGIAGILALAATGVHLLPAAGARTLLGTLVLVLNAGAFLALFHRARAFPSEARAWRILAAALPLAVLANLLFVRRGLSTAPPDFGDGLSIWLHGPMAVLSVWSLLDLPWRSGEPGHRRVHLAGAALFGGALLLSFRLLSLHPGMTLPPWTAGVLLVPLTLFMMVLHRVSAEVPDEAPRLTWPYVDLLLYLPYTLVGSALGILVLRQALVLGGLLVGFLALTAVLLLHQLVLLREVRSARDTLEMKVAARTRELEVAQALALRNERMNTVALLGAGLAHDLNNALGIITSSLDLVCLSLEEGRVPDPPDLDRIRKAAARCAGLSQRLMAFGRAQEEGPQAYDLGDLVRHGEDLLRMLLPGRIRLDLEAVLAPFPVRGVPDQMQQVLVNLVGNAKDAVPGTGWIRVGLAREGATPWVRLTVQDSGQGMPPEVRARLFQPFFTTKEAGRGTGLGLASTRAIVDRMGGRMEVESEVGVGTTFTLFLPLEV